LICWRCLGIGTSTQCLVDVKLLLTLALKCNASNIIIAHNHPSGSVRPSEADLEVTKTIAQGCELLGLLLVDHFILGGEYYYSFVGNKIITSTPERKIYKVGGSMIPKKPSKQKRQNNEKRTYKNVA
jgi:DNA repair protein RadC